MDTDSVNIEPRVVEVSPQKEFILSTKVGRVYKAYSGDPEDYSGPPWVGGLPFSLKFDYSAEGFQRSYEDSTLRLGLNRIDLLVIHDLDRGYHGDSVPEKLRQLESGIQWLQEMRGNGSILGFGAGVNDLEMMPLLLEHFEMDFSWLPCPTPCSTRNRWKIFSRNAKKEEWESSLEPLCLRYSCDGSFFRSTLRLCSCGGSVLNRVKAIEKVCSEHKIPLKAAALQFPLGHPLVASVIPGAMHPDQVRDNLAMMKHPIPDSFWRDLKNEGLLHPEAPVHSND
ncbi:MAG: aldo/keto reductase [Deltaproteobacteria bacterium]|nr:MAG: aldo/keto reductase [Deltaproteobacteria bacterium]